MSGLFASLNASSQSLAAFDRAIGISQNNVNNRSTPGYAAQIVDFSAVSFNLQSGLAGGVSASSSSTRDSYLDASVRAQLTNLGKAQQQTASLNGIENLFDVSGTTGVPGALTKLFNSFTNLSISPTSNPSRTAVLSAAEEVASSFRQVSTALAAASGDADRQISQQLREIDGLTAEISGYNAQRAQNGDNDAGRDAKLNAALEKLSLLANISTRTGAAGGTDVLLNGQIPLVLGTEHFSLHTANAGAPAQASLNPNGTPALRILDSDGRDVTDQFSGGSVAGLLQFRNTTLAGLRGDRNQNGDLNTLAKGFADRVNSLLTSGLVSEGPPAVHGTPLFAYDATDATRSAGTLSVVSGFTVSQLATIKPGPPLVSNGTVLSLANLAHGASPQDQINGSTYTQFFGEIAGGVGRLLANQKDSADLSQQASTQAQSLRSQISGVSLDAEAVRLIEYQKSYTASARLITILDQIAQTTLDILR